MKKIIFALVVTCLVAIGCKNEQKEEKTAVKTEVKAENIESASFKISGMTCEVGCAKYINKNLAKADGVIEANVVFADSIATVKFDKTKTDATKLMAYVDGMADNMYKTSDMKKCDTSKKECSDKEKKECKDGEKKDCSKDKTACKAGEGCCADKTDTKTACVNKDCKMTCCEKA